MNVEVNLTAVIALIAVGSLMVSAGTFWRAGDWRKSETWKSLEAKIADALARLTTVETRTGELPLEVRSINERLTRVEAHLDHNASKDDIAGLEAGLKGVGEEVDVVRQAVIRIEQFLLRKEA